MDFTRNVVLKEDYTFLVADEDGAVRGGEHGLYDRDTRFLSRYAWDFGEGFRRLVGHSPRPDRYHAHHARLVGPAQQLGVRRDVELADRVLRDRLTIENSSREPQRLEPRLSLDADFADLFEARGWHRLERPGRTLDRGDARLEASYRAGDGLELGAAAAFSRPVDAWDGTTASFALELAPGAAAELEVTVRLRQPLGGAAGATAPSYEAWRERFAGLPVPERHREAVERAIDDLRGLLLFTEQGPVPAAGVPWFVATFGRDALLTALMLLPWAPEVGAGTLRHLAALQGRERDERSAEAPGKIPHELRFGELARTGAVPFAPYYGTIDATPLWLMLLEGHWRRSGDRGLLEELRPAWEAALAWLTGDADRDGDGFLEFRGAARRGEGEMTGLAVQSWKDSWDSMSHADGSLAEGDLAVSEVQGYAYAAFRAAAAVHEALGEPARAAPWRERAERLRERFHAAFWLDDLGTYALALDGAKRPLRVHNSDAGHLLWCGIVPEEVAPRLVASLFSPAMWSGWGVRTLGKGERRYNPLSYHVGSVWPHDNALLAAGLVRYGFRDEARRIREAVLELATAEPDRRPPELVAGYDRVPGVPAVPYPVACRPQAWDAAALPFLLGLGL